MSDPLAYLLTWTTYGTWLPGDERGWIKRGKGYQLPNPDKFTVSDIQLTEPACLLSQIEREIVEETISKHCAIRGWILHAVSCRTNHVHVVVSANTKPELVRDQLKAWCSRRLKEIQRAGKITVRNKWWTERGSQRYIADEENLEIAIMYVLEAQNRKGEN